MNRSSSGLGHVFIVAAAIVVVFGGIALAATLVGWVLISVFLAILCRPVFGWFVSRGLSPVLALVAVALCLTGVVAGVGLIVLVSASQFVANASSYQSQLAERFAALGDWLIGLGIQVTATEVSDLLSPGFIVGMLVAALRVVISFAVNFIYILLLVLFLLVDGPAMIDRTRSGLGADHPITSRLVAAGPKVVQYFGIRAYVNLLTGAGVAVALWLLGIDYALLWGVLLFFLSFVPYIGIFLASIPPVVLALAEGGIGLALLVIVGITIVNFSLENLVMPRMVGSELSLAPSVVFVGFFFWTWLLGPSGALLSVFLTILVIVVLDSYEPTRWLATVMTGRDDDEKAPPESALSLEPALSDAASAP